MKDLTMEIGIYAKEKELEKMKNSYAKAKRVRDSLEYITEHADELDILINNANALLDAGVKLHKGTYLDSQKSYREGNFEANGVRHTLGFVFSEAPHMASRRVIGMATLGGGANGDVSVVYIQKWREAIYDTDKRYDFTKSFQMLHPLEELNERTLEHYEREASRFANSIDDFSERFEAYIDNILSK